MSLSKLIVQCAIRPASRIVITIKTAAPAWIAKRRSAMTAVSVVRVHIVVKSAGAGTVRSVIPCITDCVRSVLIIATTHIKNGC
jgi:hypothetical protein